MQNSIQTTTNQAHCQQGTTQYTAHKRILFGVVIIAIGSVLLMERLGILENQSFAHYWPHYWPLILTLFGFHQLFFAQTNHHRIHGFFKIIVSFWLFVCLEHVWGATFAMTWPILLITFGLCKIVDAVLAKHTVRNESAS